MLKRADYAAWAVSQIRRRLGRRRIVEGRGVVGSSPSTPGARGGPPPAPVPIDAPAPPRPGPRFNAPIVPLAEPSGGDQKGRPAVAHQAVNLEYETVPTPGGGVGGGGIPSGHGVPSVGGVSSLFKTLQELNADPLFYYRELKANRLTASTLSGAGPLPKKIAAKNGTWSTSGAGATLNVLGAGMALKGILVISDFARYGRVTIGCTPSVLPAAAIAYCGRGTFDAAGAFTGYLATVDKDTGTVSLSRYAADAGVLLGTVAAVWSPSLNFFLLAGNSPGVLQVYVDDNPQINVVDTTYVEGQAFIGASAVASELQNLFCDGWSRL